jgi:predicted ATP-grasp superfamily ATP-dependent carboligase
VVSREEDQKTMEKAGVKPFEDGFLAGVNSLILLEGAKRNIPVTYLMGESHHGYPDPGSAAATVEAVGKIMGQPIDIQKLLDTAEEIRLAARDLMRKTEEAMEAAAKPGETEVPVMFG